MSLLWLIAAIILGVFLWLIFVFILMKTKIFLYHSIYLPFFFVCRPFFWILRSLRKLVGRILQKKKGPFQDFITVAGHRLTDQDRLRHTHIVGATGSGKSVLLEQLIMEDIARGYGAVIIDPKGDRDFYFRIRSFAERAGRGGDFHLFSATFPRESVRWNPCRLGTAAEIQSKLLNSWIFSEPYYEKACETALLACLNKLTLRKHPFSLQELTDELQEIVGKNAKDPARGILLDLSNTLDGEWGEMLCAGPVEETKQEISILDIVRKNEILFVDLPIESKSIQSQRMGKLLLQELLLISGMRKSYPYLRGRNPYSVYVDEFDAFATKSFASFLNKGRSSGFMIHVAHQTISDLNQPKTLGEGFMGKILGNTNIRYVFRQDDPADAELWSAFFGTRNVIKETYRTHDGFWTGDASMRETKEYRIHPDRIK
jgi:hypothetical protein